MILNMSVGCVCECVCVCVFLCELLYSLLQYKMFGGIFLFEACNLNQ